jgi:O-succinylbenzoic acid--CoA ligase
VSGTPREVVAGIRAWLGEVEEPAPLIIETSGSTGSPKRVVLERSAVLASARATARRLGAEGRWLLALPPAYVAGVQVVVRSLLAGQEPVIVAEHPSFATAFAAAGDGPVFVSLVAAQLSELLDDEDDLTALRGCHTVLVGGGPFSLRLRRRTEDLGVNAVATYGSSETAGGCVYDGLPLDGVAVAVAEDGRIRIGGPTLFSGYAGDPALTAASLVDGWFLTSDQGEFDPDGRLRVLGRLDDVVVTGGVNVPTGQVSDRLLQHPGVSAAFVLGVPDDRWGQRVVGVVVPTSSPAPTLDEVRDFVAAHLPRAWAPHQLLVLGALPLLPNGKPDRAQLGALASAAPGSGG